MYERNDVELTRVVRTILSAPSSHTSSLVEYRSYRIEMLLESSVKSHHTRFESHHHARSFTNRNQSWVWETSFTMNYLEIFSKAKIGTWCNTFDGWNTFPAQGMMWNKPRSEGLLNLSYSFVQEWVDVITDSVVRTDARPLQPMFELWNTNNKLIIALWNLSGRI